MRPNIDLRLIVDSLRKVAATPYFDARVLTYSDHLCRAVEFALAHKPSLPDAALRQLSEVVWIAHQYLVGSISREAPYEMEFCLKKALDEWKKKECVITTSLSLDLYGAFHFRQADPWEIIQNILPSFDGKGFNPALILISLPRVYRSKPIFCIPLYHELGHFVDRHWGITTLAQVMIRQASLFGLSGMPPGHWAEFFADLFATCYVGESSIRVLQTAAPNNPTSATHPSTSDRVALMRAFLDGTPDPKIKVIQNALIRLGAPVLAPRYLLPTISSAYDDLRTYVVQSVPEVHGLLASAWAYFEGALANGFPWARTPLHEGNIEKVVNDLTEKSIRNYSIRMMWQNATPSAI